MRKLKAMESQDQLPEVLTCDMAECQYLRTGINLTKCCNSCGDGSTYGVHDAMCLKSTREQVQKEAKEEKEMKSMQQQQQQRKRRMAEELHWMPSQGSKTRRQNMEKRYQVATFLSIGTLIGEGNMHISWLTWNHI